MSHRIFYTLWRRLWTSPGIYIAVILAALTMFSLKFGAQPLYPDIASQLNGSFAGNSGVFTFVLCILPAFPFAMVYTQDENSGMLWNWSIRAGIRGYARAYYLITVLSGFLVIVIGGVLFILLMVLSGSPFLIDGTGKYLDFGIFLIEENPVLFVVFQLVNGAMGGAIIAGLAAMIGAFIPNRFVVYAAPLVIYMLAVRLLGSHSLPYYLNVTNLLQGAFNAPTPFGALGIKLAYLVILGGTFGLLTLWKIERRQKNG